MVAWERSGANVQIQGATATGTRGEEHYHTALGAPLPTDRPTYAELRCSGGDVAVGVARPDLELSADAGAAASSPVSRGLPAIQRELGACGPIVAQRAHGVWVELRPEQRCGQPSNGRPQPGRRVVVPI